MSDTIPQMNPRRQPRTELIFYVYVLYRPSLNGPISFYIGKGKEGRWREHESCARRNATCKHMSCRVIRKVWREGGIITKEKIAEGLTEKDAHRLECLHISLARAYQWPIVNLTNGGEGTSGYKGNTHPPSQVESHRKKMKELYASNPEFVERQRQRSKQRFEDNPELREQCRARFADPEIRAKAGSANLGNTYNAKMYQEGFRSPSGQVFTGIHHLKAFCKEHHLSSGHMGQVYLGTRVSHKGWTRYPPIEREERTTYGKAGFCDPSGTIYEAESIPNLAKFCREHDLHRTCMEHLGSGKLHSHQGWTRYPEIKAAIDYHGTYNGPALQGPDGRVYTPQEIDNLTTFCHEHSLQPSNMSLVSQGKQYAHKGWTQYPPVAQPPKFSFHAPDGTIHHVLHLGNLCKSHNLNESCMSLLHTGKLHTHKGWTRYQGDTPIQRTLF